jgi:hypothetical protein
MAIFHGSKWTALLIAGLLVAGGGYTILILSQSGLTDSAEPPLVGPLEGSGQTMDLAALPWTVFLLVATAVLGAVLAYGQYRASKVTREERQRSEDAVSETYKE